MIALSPIVISSRQTPALRCLRRNHETRCTGDVREPLYGDSYESVHSVYAAVNVPTSAAP